MPATHAVVPPAAGTSPACVCFRSFLENDRIFLDGIFNFFNEIYGIIYIALCVQVCVCVCVCVCDRTAAALAARSASSRQQDRQQNRKLCPQPASSTSAPTPQLQQDCSALEGWQQNA